MKFEATIIKTQSTTESIDSTTKINNTVVTINTNCNNNFKY